MLMPLLVNAITQVRGYEFKREDQSIYLSKDLCKFVPRRQWPEITLPMPTEAPPQPAPLGPNTQLVRAMQTTHDTAADTQKLRSHIRSRHCHKAAYKCSVCSKPFGDPYAHSHHKRVHAAATRKYVCVHCGNAYLSKSKLS